jgi:3-oxoacyl-[acyl-carrier protein] reductase
MSGLGVVTGGARGIGLAIVRALLDDGVVDEVAVLDADPADLSEAKCYACDVTDEASVAAALSAIGTTPRVLVNNAGGAGPGAPNRTSMPFDPFPSIDDWRADIDLNLTSAFIVSRAIAPNMAEGSVICNTASIAGVVPGPLMAYGAAKAALIHWTREMAQALAPRQIRVNAVAPGFIYTRLWEAMIPSRETFLQMVSGQVPMRSDQSPEDIAAAVSFLCSDRAAQITGQVIAIDGGSSNRPA